MSKINFHRFVDITLELLGVIERKNVEIGLIVSHSLPSIGRFSVAAVSRESKG